MIDKSNFTPYLIVWGVTAAVLVWKTWKNVGAGLVLSYCFQLFMLYWLGAFLHSLPGTDLPDTDYVFLGFQASTHAILAFAAGCFAMGPWLESKVRSKARPPIVPDLNLPRIFTYIGVGFFFIVAPTLGQVSGFNAIAAAGSQMVVVGISLQCWRAWSTGIGALLRALAPAILIPMATLMVHGFLSFGVIALATIIIFCGQFFRPRWLLLIAGLALGYVGLSGYAAYMRDREELRALVWGGESFADRFAGFKKTAETAEWFDVQNSDQIGFVDARLNQNVLVGNAIAYLENTGNYAHGSTLTEALINMIPRVIWPSKPTAAGSGGLAARFTGISFSDGTSIGIGPVMELYANFGDMGIWIGFALLGAFIQAMDTLAGYHLRNGTWLDFGRWYLVGISFLNVSGSFVECSAGAVASLVLAHGIRTILRKRNQKAALRQQMTPAHA